MGQDKYKILVFWVKLLREKGILRCGPSTRPKGQDSDSTSNSVRATDDDKSGHFVQIK